MFRSALTSVAFLGVLVPSAVLGEPVIKSGGPCHTSSGLCVLIESEGDIPSISALRFTAPSDGTISVTATGAMQCSNTSSNTTQAAGVFDLNAQIVSDNRTPDGSGPGGMRFSSRLPPLNPPAAVYSSSVNLASTRVFPVKKGVNIFRYKMTRNRVDAAVACAVFNVTMSGVFVP